jgi:hypothetical protein
MELGAVATTLNSLQHQYREAALTGDDDRVHRLRTKIRKLEADYDQLVTQLLAKLGRNRGMHGSEALS